MKWRPVLYAVSIVGLASAVLTDHRAPEDAVVEPVARSAATRPEPPRRAAAEERRAASAPQAEILALVPRARLGGIADAGGAGTAFGARSWAPPPSPAASSAAESTTPQPLPFSYIGKQAVGDSWQVFIAEKDDVRMVQVADLIDEQYKVLAIDAQTMTLDYLPLHAKLSMSLE